MEMESAEMEEREGPSIGQPTLLRTTICGAQGITTAISGRFYFPHSTCAAVARTDWTVDLWEKVPTDAADLSLPVPGFEGWLGVHEQEDGWEDDMDLDDGMDVGSFKIPRLRLLSRHRMPAEIHSLHRIRRSQYGNEYDKFIPRKRGPPGDACDWLLVMLKDLSWVLIGDQGEDLTGPLEACKWQCPKESPGRRERLVVSVSEFMPHGEVLVAAAVFKGFISTLRINVSRGRGSGGQQAASVLAPCQQQQHWRLEWELDPPTAVWTDERKVASGQHYEITQLALVEHDWQAEGGEDRTGWRLAVAHGSEPGPAAYPGGAPESVTVRYCTIHHHPELKPRCLTDEGNWRLQDVPPTVLLRPAAQPCRLMLVTGSVIKTCSSHGQASLTRLPPNPAAPPLPDDGSGLPPPSSSFFSAALDVCSWTRGGAGGQEQEEGVGLTADGRVFRFTIHDKTLQGWSSLVKLGQVPSLTWLCPLDNDDAEVHSHFLVGSAYSRCQVMVLRGDRGRLRPCKALANGVVPVEAAVLVNLSSSSASSRAIGPANGGHAAAGGDGRPEQQLSATYPTVALASGGGKAGRLSLLQRSLGMDVITKGDVGLSGPASGSFDLLATPAPLLGGDLLVLTSGSARATYSMLVRPDGTAEPVDLPALDKGARCVAVGTTRGSNQLVVVTVAGVKVLSADGQTELCSKTAVELIGNWAPLWVPFDSPIDYATVLCDEQQQQARGAVVVLSIHSAVLVLSVDRSTGQLTVDRHRPQTRVDAASISALTAYLTARGSVVMTLAYWGTIEVVFLEVVPPTPGTPMTIERESCVALLPRYSDVRSILFHRALAHEPPLLLVGLAEGQLLVVALAEEDLHFHVRSTVVIGRCIPRLVAVPSLSAVYINSEEADWLLSFQHAGMAPTVQPIHTLAARRTVVPLSPAITRSPDGPQPSLAWLDPTSCLCFGSISHCLTGRATSQPVQQTPSKLLYLPQLQTLVVITEVPGDPPHSSLRCFLADSLIECSAPIPFADGQLVSALSEAPAPPRASSSSADSSPPRSATIAVASYSFDHRDSSSPAADVGLGGAPPFSALVLFSVLPLPPAEGHSSPRLELQPLAAIQLQSASFFLALSLRSSSLLVTTDHELCAYRCSSTPGDDGDESSSYLLQQAGKPVQTPHGGCVTALALVTTPSGEEVVVISEFMAGIQAYQVRGDATLRMISMDLRECPSASLLAGIEWGATGSHTAVLAYDQFKKEFLLFSWSSRGGPRAQDDDDDAMAQDDGGEQEEEGAMTPIEEMTLVARWVDSQNVAAIVGLGKGVFLTVGSGGSVYQYKPFTASGGAAAVPTPDRGPVIESTALLRPKWPGSVVLEVVPAQLKAFIKPCCLRAGGN